VVAGIAGRSIALPASEADRLGLGEGAEADPERVADSARKAQEKAAGEDSARYLAGAERTTSRLRSFLARRHYLPSVIEEAVARAIGYGWVDDARFASAMVRGRPGRGKARLLADLVARGVSRQAAAEAVSGIDEGEELEAALPLVIRRYSGLDRETALRRAAGFLTRRGFSRGSAWRAARRALGAAGGEDPEKA
jgi:regulatory protein